MCVRPITIKNPDPQKMLGPNLSVPCGSCCECLKDRQNGWKLRLMEESNNWQYLYFFTLTYRDEDLPVTSDGLSTACKYDVQTWLKRFRIQYKRLMGFDLPLKYFICAEYGPNGTHRPHYHGLLMTDAPDVLVSPLFADWRKRKGFVDVSSISCDQGERQAVSNYCSKYCCKGEFASRRKDIEAGLIEKAWTIVSKGVGSSYVSRMSKYHLPYGKCDFSPSYLDKVIERSKVVFQVNNKTFSYRMPRYYRERLFNVRRGFEVNVWDKRINAYVKKTVYRYSAKDVFSFALSCRVRDRFLEKFRRIEQASGLSDIFFTNVEMYCEATRTSSDTLRIREDKVRRSLLSFYQTNANKWRHL